MSVTPGTSSCNKPSRFASISLVNRVYPVTFLPGRLKLSTKPALIGSLPIPNTTGIVEVARVAARAEGSPPSPASTATRRRTSSAASAGSKSYWPRAQRNSMAMFWPSTKPISPKPCRNAATKGTEFSRRPGAHKPYNRHRRLLRARRHRQRYDRAAEQADELPSPHAEHGGSLPGAATYHSSWNRRVQAVDASRGWSFGWP